MINKIAAFAVGLWLSIGCAFAQTSPNLTYGQVLTPAQWNQLFINKNDTLGYTPLNVAGGVMTGRLVTAPISTTTAGLNLTCGSTAPTTPVNGDEWCTSAGLFVQINGATVGPLANTIGPITFTGQITTQGLTTTQPGWYAQLTGDTSARVRLGLNSTDVPSLAFGPGNADRDAFIERLGAGSLRFGAPDAAAPVAQTLGVQNVLAGTSNAAGAALTIAGSRGTGTGVGGDIIFQVAPAGSTGSTQNALVNALHIFGTGGIATGAGTDPGAGNLNLAGGVLWNNGTAPTGTGGYVRATGASLVTPALGVATGTSLALGGATVGSNALAVTGTLAFPNNSLTLAEFPTIGANTVLGSIAGGTPAALSQAQLSALITLGAVPGYGTIGQFVIGTGTTADAFTIHGQQNFYFPNLASDPGCFCNTFISNGGANLTHAVVNTTAPGVSTSTPGTATNGTLTITIAAPSVITWTGSSLAQDTPVAFTSSGTLPTGITSGTTYFVARSPVPTTNTFSIAATIGGSAITTTGSQSGTQTGYTIRLEGRYNIGIGQQSLPAVTNGSYNTSTGFEGMFNIISGSWNTGFGEATLFSNVNGNANTAVGWKALLSSTDSNNTAIGYGSMLNSATGGSNVAVGYASLNGAASSTFSGITGVGFGVGGVLSSATNDVLIGTSAASAMTTGSQSVIIGYLSGANVTTANGNTFIGYQTGGGVTTGGNNTLIGGNQTSLSSTLANEIRLSDGTGALGFRSDSSRNTYLGDSATGRNVYNYFSASTNNAGTTADSGGVWHVFTGLSGTANWLNIYPDGSTTLGVPTGANKGAGTLNTAAPIYENNIPVSLTIASGTASIPSTAISAGSCGTAITVTATGVLTTDVASAGFASDPTSTTGFLPTAMLSIVPYAASGSVGFRVCNLTGSSITPTALTFNWRVVR